MQVRSSLTHSSPEFAKEIPFLQISEISWQFSEITLDCLSFPGHERHFVSP